MPETSPHDKGEPKIEAVVEKLRAVESFTTDHGSVYTYYEFKSHRL